MLLKRKPILISILLFTLVVIGINCDKKQNVPSAQCPAGRIPTSVNNICIVASWGGQVDRPAGGWVFLEIDASAEQKALIGQAIEAGLRQTITGAQHHNPTWTIYGHTMNYGVVLIKKQATNQDGTPALIVSGIQTAGTVINVYSDGNPRGSEPVIVLPMPDTWPPAGDPYWSYLQASARHEGEHVIEYKNDLSEFLRRAVRADIHPHWPLSTEGVGFASATESGCLKAINNSVPPVKIGR